MEDPLGDGERLGAAVLLAWRRARKHWKGRCGLLSFWKFPSLRSSLPDILIPPAFRAARYPRGIHRHPPLGSRVRFPHAPVHGPGGCGGALPPPSGF